MYRNTAKAKRLHLKELSSSQVGLNYSKMDASSLKYWSSSRQSIERKTVVTFSSLHKISRRLAIFIRDKRVLEVGFTERRKNGQPGRTSGTFEKNLVGNKRGKVRVAKTISITFPRAEIALACNERHWRALRLSGGIWYSYLTESWKVLEARNPSIGNFYSAPSHLLADFCCPTIAKFPVGFLTP